VTGTYTADDPAETVGGDFLLIAAAGASLTASDVATNIRWTGEAGPQNANTTLIEGVDATTQIAANAGGGGTGARTVTVTVNDGTTTLSSAIVRFVKGAESYSATTNGSGVATFNLDDGTWTVSITKAGYTFAGTTLVVDGTETPTYSMTAVSITPAADPAQTTAYLTTRTGAGVAKPSVTLTLKLLRGPGDAGSSYDTASLSATSNGSGLLQVTLLREARYAVTRGDGREYQVTTPDASTYELPEHLGLDA